MQMRFRLRCWICLLLLHRGPEGNIEYLIHLRKNPERTVYPDIPAVFEKKIKEIVEEAHQELEKP